jgi:hypothetical protein
LVFQVKPELTERTEELLLPFLLSDLLVLKSGSFDFGREDGFPIVLHADNGPAFGDGELSGFVRAG